MASLKSYAKRVESLREAMNETLETWQDELETMESKNDAGLKRSYVERAMGTRSQTKLEERLQAKIEILTEAISTLENLEMELES